jgi:hypothetical protein
MGSQFTTLKTPRGEVVLPWFVDTMVLEQYRQKGIGSQIMLQAEEDMPIALSLGQTAEDTMMGRIREAGGPANYDLSWFAFSNGVDCKARERVCRVSKHSDKVDAAHTKALFGR